MIKIENPYSEKFKGVYWEWFSKKFNVTVTTLLSEIFPDGKYEFKTEYLIKDVLIDMKTYYDISQNIFPIDNSILKIDFINAYDEFVNRKSMSISSEMNAKKLYHEIGIKVCPYCNLNDISMYETNTKSKRGHLDHFYSKIKFPYLALSIYNLVPSCATCNSSFKGESEMNIKQYIHPYFEQFGDEAVFDYLPFSYKSPSKLEESLFKNLEYLITFKYSNMSSKARNNNNMFQLAFDDAQNVLGVYQEQKEYVSELIEKIHNYPIENINYIYSEIFKERRPKDAILEDIFGKKIDIEDIINHQKSKLRNDILKKYNVYF